MCGIVGYIGKRDAAPILLDGLKRLEYRGYDSAGIATLSKKKFHIKKDKGKIADIDRKLDFARMPGNVGVGHTRWATHGAPSKINAHPHADCHGKLVVVHNGIIENYAKLKKFLKQKGYRFISNTDTEVIPNLISYFMRRGKNLEKSVRSAVEKLKGSFALAIISADEPDTLIAVRKESPLIVGVGKGEMFLASDIPAVLKHTNRIIVLENGEMAIIKPSGAVIKKTKSGGVVRKRSTKVTWTAEMAEKGGFAHFTLKEIHQQPEVIKNTLRVPRAELEKLAKFLLGAERVYLVACGTSYHAALVGKYALAKLANLSVEAVISSEFQESCRANGKTAVLGISQSGETADTLKALRIAKESGARTACLTNVVESSITRESDVVCYTHAGPEVSVVATKTFVAQVTYLLLLSVYLAERRGMSKSKICKLIARLNEVPDAARAVLARVEPHIRKLAKKYSNSQHIYLIGRGIGYPIVLEAALKLKEITYIHSEGMPAGELKHGTLALIERDTPVIAVVPPGASQVRMVGNIEEVKARGATVIAIADESDDVKEHVDEFIPVPSTEELFSPLTYIIPAQLLAYYMTVERGQDPDRPRSLAKSVTVE
ncbi:MAG: glutamine--fructose-6-phosphate transaminase (isomerizing) [Hadesarchaea archaeon]|nr:MAG: glutamine--fructose-6-phosphate transaminase (isomerizing) [Hadesarchaea archaeon]